LSTLLAEATFAGRLGEVQAVPTVNTLLWRLKDIQDRIDNWISIDPAVYNTTDAFAEITGSLLDVPRHKSLNYTIKNTGGTNSLDWKVQARGTFASAEWVDLSVAATLGPGAIGNWGPKWEESGYPFYRLMAKSTTAGNSTTAQVRGFAKPL
jgi:hypothetical protein